jgi:hypothetical protein
MAPDHLAASPYQRGRRPADAWILKTQVIANQQVAHVETNRKSIAAIWLEPPPRTLIRDSNWCIVQYQSFETPTKALASNRLPRRSSIDFGPANRSRIDRSMRDPAHFTPLACSRMACISSTLVAMRRSSLSTWDILCSSTAWRSAEGGAGRAHARLQMVLAIFSSERPPT